MVLYEKDKGETGDKELTVILPFHARHSLYAGLESSFLVFFNNHCKLSFSQTWPSSCDVCPLPMLFF